DEPEFIRRTEYVGPVIIQNNIVINNIIDIDYIQQETQQEVTIVEAQPVEDPEQAVAEATPEQGAIPVFEPEIEAPAEDVAPPEAIEEEQAAEQRAEYGQAEAEGEVAAPAEGEAPAEQAAPAEGEGQGAAAAEECPEGQQLVEG